MFEFPSSLVAKLSETLKPQSILRYKAWLRKYVFGDQDYNVSTLVNFHKKIDDELKAKKDYTSILSAIIAVLKAEDKPTNIYEKLKSEHLPTFYAEPTQADKDNQITVAEIKTLREETEASYAESPTMAKAYHLQFLYFITELPPLRSQDYINTSFTDKLGVNLLDIDNKLLIIKGGKSVHSKRTIKLPQSVLSKVVEFKDRYGSDWLFPQLKNINVPMTNSGFNKYLARLFKRNISTSRIRQIMVSHWKDKNLSTKQRAETARVMGHTLKTSEASYTKFSQQIHEKDELILKQKRQIAILKAKLKRAEEKAK